MSWRSSVSPASALCRRLVVGQHSTRPVPCALPYVGHHTCSRTLCSRQSFATYSAYCHSDTQKNHLLQLTSRQHVRSAAYFQQSKSGLQTCRATAEPATPSAQHAASPEKKQLTMDYTALVASVQELKDKWIPAKVEQIVQSDKQSLCLRIRTLEGSTWLHFCWHPVSGRMCTGPSPQRGAAAEAFSFGEQLQSQIRGLVLLNAIVPQAWERVVQLSLGTRPGADPTYNLFFELMGRYSNVICAEPDGHITLCAYQVGSKMSSARQLQTGGTYQLPPPASGIEPAMQEAFSTWKDNVTQTAQLIQQKQGRAVTVADGLVRAYQGVSPALSLELCSLAGIVPQDPSNTPSADWEALRSQWQAWLTRLSQGDFTAGVDGKTGRYSVLGSFPAVESIHQAMHDYHSESEGHEQFKQLQQQLSTVLKQAHKRMVTKMNSLQQQMGSSEQCQALQKQADMLMANIYRWKPGITEMVVEDWDTGHSVSLPIEDGVSAVDAAEGLYKQARKRRRAGDKVVPLLEAAQDGLTYLEEVQEAFDQVPSYGDAEDLVTLKGIQEELVAGKYMRAPAGASLAEKGLAKGKKAMKRAGTGSNALQGFRKYTAPSGLQVLVGRNNKQNDELTNRVAKAGDVWMHARGFPGAHVLLRASAANREASDADVQYAADIAAWYSKGKGEGKCPVIMASPTDIKKPKGAPPGKVLVTKESTTMGRPANSAPAQEESKWI